MRRTKDFSCYCIKLLQRPRQHPAFCQRRSHWRRQSVVDCCSSCATQRFI